jgi:hypothetical protein
VGYGCRALGCWVLRVLGWVCCVFFEGLGWGVFVLVSSGSRGMVLVGFFLSFFGLFFFYFKHCVFSCILPVY